MNIDIALLREQIEFLDNYSWRERKDIEFVQGIINLLDAVLDEELGNE
jgi:hypothetical protein